MSRIRAIVTARNAAGCIVILLPSIVRDEVGIKPGDRVEVCVSEDRSFLEVRKE